MATAGAGASCFSAWEESFSKRMRISRVVASQQTTQVQQRVMSLKSSLQAAPNRIGFDMLLTITAEDRSRFFSFSQLRTSLRRLSDLTGKQPSWMSTTVGSATSVAVWVTGLYSAETVRILSSTMQNSLKRQEKRLDLPEAPSSCALSSSAWQRVWMKRCASVKYRFLPRSWMSSLVTASCSSFSPTSAGESSVGISTISLRADSATLWLSLLMAAMERQVLPAAEQTVRKVMVRPSSALSVWRTEAELSWVRPWRMVVSSLRKQGSATCCSAGRGANLPPMRKEVPLTSRTRLYSGSQQTMYLTVCPSFLKQSLQLMRPLPRTMLCASLRLASRSCSYLVRRQVRRKSTLASAAMSSITWQPQQRSAQTLTSERVVAWVPILMKSVSLVSAVIGLISMLASQIWSLALKNTFTLSLSSDFFSSTLMMTDSLRRTEQVVLTASVAATNWSFWPMVVRVTSLYSLTSLTRPSLLSTLMFSFSMSETSRGCGRAAEVSRTLRCSGSAMRLVSRRRMLRLTLSAATEICRGARSADLQSRSYCSICPMSVLRTASRVQPSTSRTFLVVYSSTWVARESTLKVSREEQVTWLVLVTESTVQAITTGGCATKLGTTGRSSTTTGRLSAPSVTNSLVSLLSLLTYSMSQVATLVSSVLRTETTEVREVREEVEEEMTELMMGSAASLWGLSSRCGLGCGRTTLLMPGSVLFSMSLTSSVWVLRMQPYCLSPSSVSTTSVQALKLPVTVDSTVLMEEVSTSVSVWRQVWRTSVLCTRCTTSVRLLETTTVSPWTLCFSSQKKGLTFCWMGLLSRRVDSWVVRLCITTTCCRTLAVSKMQEIRSLDPTLSTITATGDCPEQMGNSETRKVVVAGTEGMVSTAILISSLVKTFLVSVVVVVVVVAVVVVSMTRTEEVSLSQMEVTWVTFSVSSGVSKRVTTLTLSGYSTVVEEMMVLVVSSECDCFSSFTRAVVISEEVMTVVSLVTVVLVPVSTSTLNSVTASWVSAAASMMWQLSTLTSLVEGLQLTTTSTLVESEETPSTVMTSLPKTVWVEVALVTVLIWLTGISLEASMNWTTLARMGLLMGTGTGSTLTMGEVVVLGGTSLELQVPTSVTSLVVLSTLTMMVTVVSVSVSTVSLDWQKVGYSTAWMKAMRSGVTAGYLVAMYLTPESSSEMAVVASVTLLEMTVRSPYLLVVSSQTSSSTLVVTVQESRRVSFSVVLSKRQTYCCLPVGSGCTAMYFLTFPKSSMVMLSKETSFLVVVLTSEMMVLISVICVAVVAMRAAGMTLTKVRGWVGSRSWSRVSVLWSTTVISLVSVFLRVVTWRVVVVVESRAMKVFSSKLPQVVVWMSSGVACSSSGTVLTASAMQSWFSVEWMRLESVVVVTVWLVRELTTLVVTLSWTISVLVDWAWVLMRAMVSPGWLRNSRVVSLPVESLSCAVQRVEMRDSVAVMETIWLLAICVLLLLWMSLVISRATSDCCSTCTGWGWPDSPSPWVPSVGATSTDCTSTTTYSPLTLVTSICWLTLSTSTTTLQVVWALWLWMTWTDCVDSVTVCWKCALMELMTVVVSGNFWRTQSTLLEVSMVSPHLEVVCSTLRTVMLVRVWLLICFSCCVVLSYRNTTCCLPPSTGAIAMYFLTVPRSSTVRVSIWVVEVVACWTEVMMLEISMFFLAAILMAAAGMVCTGQLTTSFFCFSSFSSWSLWTWTTWTVLAVVSQMTVAWTDSSPSEWRRRVVSWRCWQLMVWVATGWQMVSSGCVLMMFLVISLTEWSFSITVRSLVTTFTSPVTVEVLVTVMTSSWTIFFSAAETTLTTWTSSPGLRMRVTLARVPVAESLIVATQVVVKAVWVALREVTVYFSKVVVFSISVLTSNTFTISFLSAGETGTTRTPFSPPASPSSSLRW